MKGFDWGFDMIWEWLGWVVGFGVKGFDGGDGYLFILLLIQSYIYT